MLNYDGSNDYRFAYLPGYTLMRSTVSSDERTRIRKRVRVKQRIKIEAVPAARAPFPWKYVVFGLYFLTACAVLWLMLSWLVR